MVCIMVDLLVINITSQLPYTNFMEFFKRKDFLGKFYENFISDWRTDWKKLESLIIDRIAELYDEFYFPKKNFYF